jgi:hypothetical protein
LVPAAESAVEEDPAASELTEPGGTAYLDRVTYRSVHFFGDTFCEALRETVNYLGTLEKELGKQPHILCLHHEFSPADGGTELAWRVTIVLGELNFESH